ncbi:MAG: SBBP repeat-containing protein, partial [candidate division KSB1 bacterium]|nr:SBBP repeat-containing protein [candidate division KSB1 bacterium]
MKRAKFFLRQRVLKRLLLMPCLLVMLLSAVFAQAQDFSGLENSAKDRRLLARGLERYLPNTDLDRKDADGDIDGVPSAPPGRWSKRWKYFDESHLDAPRSLSAKLSSSFGSLSPNALGRVDTAWVRHYAAGLNPSLDVATDIALDASGNVYVTGYSSGSPWGVDFVTIKYDASGSKIWEARYNGPGNGDDLAYALAVDDAGNVYVTGVSYDVNTSDDYTTIKYNNAGVQQWVARYNGIGNSFDEATALAVDMAGNVYVTGRSWGVGTLDDYATIKYNAAGAEQWVARYSGPGDFYDVAVDIAVDASNNVYVTGWSQGVNTGSYFATIKYNGAGIQQWVARYSGLTYGNDMATDLAVDAMGNVYVTGASVGSSTSFDYATIKYNGAGAPQWVARYNGPGNSYDMPTALAVDAAGNVYVTGQSEGSGTSADYATIKYNSAGVEQWVVRYDRTGNSRDVPASLALDAAGHVYVTGESEGSGSDDYVTIQYDSAGVQQWLASYNRPGNYAGVPPALAVDATGNVHVAGQRVASTSLDYVVVKLNNAGSIQWLVTYNGPHKSPLAQAVALAVDAAGNVYVTGWIRDPATDYDYVTIKYSTDGVVQWIARYDAGNNLDIPTAMAVDTSGNIFVTGRSRLPFSSASDYATIKYNSDGVQQWVARYDRPGNNSDVPEALAVDAAGNIYVTGSSRDAATDYDYATIKYNSNGIEQWVSHYNGPANSTDLATALAIDTVGNVYVTGYGLGSGTDYDYATIKYNAAGQQEWVARYNGPGNARDEAVALVVDAGSNVYVTGRSRGSGTDYDYATIKYNSAGVQQWAARYNGPANNWDVATALGVDAAGNVYVTGESYGTGTNFDYATFKYNPAGIQQWVARYNGPENSFDRATALALDDEGNVYVTGTIGHEKRTSPG